MKYRIVQQNGHIVKDENHKTVFSPPAKGSRRACRLWIKERLKDANN